MKDKTEKKNNDIFNMARSIMRKDNVNAYKLLEKIMKQKISDKIDDALSRA